MKFDEYIGVAYNSLAILEVWRDKDKGETMCKCLCDCGNEHITYLHKVRYGQVKSCGCKRGNRKHGEHRHRLYRIWQAMKSRCSNPRTMNYKYYGGKGVKVDERWSDYSQFAIWAKSNGYKDRLTIDRIDPNGNYCPENCRWVTMKEQNNKHKSNLYQVHFRGDIYSLRDFTDIIGESYSKLQTQLQRGKTTMEQIEEKYNSKGMYLNEYQKQAMTTCTDSSRNFAYALTGLNAENGEINDKIAKGIRKEIITIVDGQIYPGKNGVDGGVYTLEYLELIEGLLKEIGDNMWFNALLATMLNSTLEEICQNNLRKLEDRQKRGVIIGNGDNR